MRTWGWVLAGLALSVGGCSKELKLDKHVDIQGFHVDISRVEPGDGGAGGAGYRLAFGGARTGSVTVPCEVTDVRLDPKGSAAIYTCGRERHVLRFLRNEAFEDPGASPDLNALAPLSKRALGLVDVTTKQTPVLEHADALSLAFREISATEGSPGVADLLAALVSARSPAPAYFKSEAEALRMWRRELASLDAKDRPRVAAAAEAALGDPMASRLALGWAVYGARDPGLFRAKVGPLLDRLLAASSPDAGVASGAWSLVDDLFVRGMQLDVPDLGARACSALARRADGVIATALLAAIYRDPATRTSCAAASAPLGVEDLCGGASAKDDDTMRGLLDKWLHAGEPLDEVPAISSELRYRLASAQGRLEKDEILRAARRSYAVPDADDGKLPSCITPLPLRAPCSDEIIPYKLCMLDPADPSPRSHFAFVLVDDRQKRVRFVHACSQATERCHADLDCCLGLACAEDKCVRDVGSGGRKK